MISSIDFSIFLLRNLGFQRRAKQWHRGSIPPALWDHLQGLVSLPSLLLHPLPRIHQRRWSHPWALIIFLPSALRVPSLKCASLSMSLYPNPLLECPPSLAPIHSRIPPWLSTFAALDLCPGPGLFLLLPTQYILSMSFPPAAARSCSLPTASCEG